MNKKYGSIPVFKWLEINKLIISNEYQRKTDSRASKLNIETIKNNFNWSKFLPLSVCDNGNDTFNVMDGGHRLQAAKELGDISELPCWIIPQVDTATQADNFVGINKNRVTVNPFQIFYAKIAAKDPKAVLVKNFCDDNGIEISRNGATPNKPEITLAISLLGRSVPTKAKELSFVLSIIRQALPGMCGQLRADIMDCLLRFRTQNGAGAEKENIRQILINVLRNFGDVNLIARQAMAAKATDNQSYKYHFNRIFIEAYKKELKRIAK